ncbi:MAG: SRPBCC family protein [Actinomycetota bacterium]|nr:SRPBCC family protein [Actinomycetota bacterium]
MSSNSRLVKAGADEVWRVLADGWLYPVFVVGASRMRDVDARWPEAGAELHHSVGVWPALIDDTTAVLESQPPTMLRLRARAWPGGEAEVTFRLKPQGPETEVTIEEDAVSGPGRLVPKPLRDPPLTWRNVETLRRLAFIAERRTG